jgi:hypothetical protein
MLFGDNMVVINPQDIGNSFNGSYADKNIIAIEESRFENVQSTEKLKNLSTQKKILVNSKFVQQYSLPFYGKLIITSNDENKFSKVDNPEIRYWIRKIPSLKGKANHNILNDLVKEIPHFLHYLDTLPDVDLNKSRMVFTAKEIETDALTLVKKESRSELHKEIILYLKDHCEENPDVKELLFAPIDIKRAFFPHNNQVSATYIKKVIQTELKLEKIERQTRYTPIEKTGLNNSSKTGTPYRYTNPFHEGTATSNGVEADLIPF